MCVFNVFYAFGTRFQSFWSRSLASKDISYRVRNRMPDKNVFRQSRFFKTSQVGSKNLFIIQKPILIGKHM